MRYAWAPRWQYLDRDDLLHFFCLLDFRIHDRKMQDRNFPARLKRLFTRCGFLWRWEGRVDHLEYDDVAYLSQFLKIIVPRAAAEAPDFGSRPLRHLHQRDDGDYDWKPNMRLLSNEETTRIISFYDFTIPADRYNAGNFPARLKCYFKAVEPVKPPPPPLDRKMTSVAL